MADRDTSIPGNQILDDSVTQSELDITNIPTDGQFIKINMPSGDFTAVDAPSIVDLTATVAVNQTNIVLNAFRIAIDASRSIFNMVDGIVDEYEDESGVDTANSTNEDYDSVNDLYSPTAPSLTPAPFSHMKLENNTDEGTGANAVTDIGTPTYTSGKLNNALTTDGSTDALNLDALASDINSDTTGSISFWFKVDSLSAIRYVFSVGDTDGQPTMVVRINTNGIVRFRHQTASVRFVVDSSTAVSTGIFYHVVLVQDGVSPKLYFNGVDETVLVNTTDLTSWLSDGVTFDNARLGCFNNNNNGNIGFFPGQIDDFRYYQNTVLTQADVDFLYNSGTGTEESQPSGTTENMTLISDVFTAEAQPDTARIVLFEEDVDSVTLNTDLKVFATRDAGQTFTTDFSTDNKLDITSHGFSNDDRIMVTSSSQDLPDGLDPATVYYVINSTTNDLELSLTSSGSAVSLSDNGTGTHTAKQVSEITLANDGEYENGKNILTGSADVSGQQSGTTMEHTIVTANAKDLKIHGASLSWN